MVDFDKLNAMIDEVNNIITDVKNETANIENAISKKEEDILAIMWKDWVSYFDIINKCTNRVNWNHCFFVDGVAFTFEYKTINKNFAPTVYVIAVEPDGQRYIWDAGMYGKDNPEYVYNRIKSCNTLTEIMKFANKWESDYKNIFDDTITIYAESLLKEKSKIAHAKYNTAKEKAERYKI